MKIFLNDKIFEFSQNELDNMYIDEGKEGIVYRYGDYVLKIYHPCSRKERLSEDMVRKLTKIHTDKFLLPLGLIFNNTKKFCGYYSKRVVSNSLDYISNMPLNFLYNEIKEFERDIDLLTNNHVEINDFLGINILYDGSFYMCDPGSFLFDESYSFDELKKINIEKLNRFFIDEVIGKDCSIRKLNNIYNFFGDLSIPLYNQLTFVERPNETIRQFVKRIS